MRRRRWRTVMLWAGWSLCGLIASLFVASGWWVLAIQIPTPYGPAFVVTSGLLGVTLGDMWDVALQLESLGPAPSGLGWRNYWNYWDAGERYLYVPLYALFVAVLLPTLLIWRFVPKFPRGHCRRCGYNLTGLTEARCPECGAGFGRNVSDGSAMSLKTKLFPELERCRSATERAAAWKFAQRRLGAHRTYRIVFLSSLTAILILPFALPLLGVPIERRGLFRGINLLIVILLCGLGSLMFRSKTRRSLREYLATIGIPVCVNCGYNLTGLPEPRCPECGQPFEPKGDMP